MTTIRTTLAFAAAVASLAAGTVTAAQAGGHGKEVFVQDYKLSKPLHGYSGHAGNYYCDYQRLPERRCVVVNGVEKCKIVGWTLQQICQ